jgi:hypothetical protein
VVILQNVAFSRTFPLPSNGKGANGFFSTKMARGGQNAMAELSLNVAGNHRWFRPNVHCLYGFSEGLETP